MWGARDTPKVGHALPCLRPLSSRERFSTCVLRYFQDMVNDAARLSRGFAFVRVDFFIMRDSYAFAELTFTPSACWGGGLIPPALDGLYASLAQHSGPMTSVRDISNKQLDIAEQYARTGHTWLCDEARNCRWHTVA